MVDSTRFAGPDIRQLFGLFAPSDDLPEYEVVPADEVPPPYHALLVHEHHMTVSMEAYHGGPVDVQVLETAQTGEWYARKILLTLRKTGRVVQFGIPRVHLRYCSPEVQAEILAKQKPLGRILIEHDVLRRIHPTSYLRVIPSRAMMEWFGLDYPKRTYGRLAMIYCDDQPAIELVEIAAPE